MEKWMQQIGRAAGLGLLSLILSGCGSMQRNTPEAQIGLDSVPKFQVTRVFYATNRKKIATAVGTPSPTIPGNTVSFSASRGVTSYGVAEVSIPREHEMGVVERPSLLRFEIREDSTKHIVLRDTVPLTVDQFYPQVALRVQALGENSAFVFVHGYNVSFEDAALRTAQISYDLGFKGAPVFYSWPSAGGLSAYTADEDSAAWSQPDLTQFLREFAARSQADKIYLIGHSMGTRVLTRAYLAALEAEPALKTRFKEIILAAPDIDADVFRRELAPALLTSGASVTLYASSQDKALSASRAVHGDNRAGDTYPKILIQLGVESIDASTVDTSFVGHSYYGKKTIISDMFYMFGSGLRAWQRSGLLATTTADGTYWKFKP